MEEVPLNVQIQQRNLLYVCSLAVKAMIDKACKESIVEENCHELYNLLAVIEHILMFQIKPKTSWYGVTDARWFWEYIKIACKKVSHNCVPSIESIANVKSPRGKGRAWLRMALMEKRLSDYLAAATQQKELTRSYYLPGSLLLGDEAGIVVGNLIGLNALDFSFDIKSANLDDSKSFVVDYTPFLVLPNREIIPPMPPARSSKQNDEKEKEEKRRSLSQQLILQAEQKGYFEELVKLREMQLEEAVSDRDILQMELKDREQDHNQEKHQLESVVLELQAQITGLRGQHKKQIKKLQDAFDGSSHPMARNLPLIQITNAPKTPESPPPFYAPPNHSIGVQADCHSVFSIDSKSLQSNESSTASLLKDETQSMIPMTGSLTKLVLDGKEREQPKAEHGSDLEQSYDSNTAGSNQEVKKSSPHVRWSMTSQDNDDEVHKSQPNGDINSHNNADNQLSKCQDSAQELVTEKYSLDEEVSSIGDMAKTSPDGSDGETGRQNSEEIDRVIMADQHTEDTGVSYDSSVGVIPNELTDTGVLDESSGESSSAVSVEILPEVKSIPVTDHICTDMNGCPSQNDSADTQPDLVTKGSIRIVEGED